MADVADLGSTAVWATVDGLGDTVSTEDASTVSAVVLKTERQTTTHLVSIVFSSAAVISSHKG